MSIFGVILVCIFPHSDWAQMRENTDQSNSEYGTFHAVVNSTANVPVRIFARIFPQYVSYIKLLYRGCYILKALATLRFIMYFLIPMFDKGVASSTINSRKWVVAAILRIPTYPSINKHSLLIRYMSGIFNLPPPKPKPSNVSDVDTLLRYLRTNLIFTQKPAIAAGSTQA